MGIFCPSFYMCVSSYKTQVLPSLRMHGKSGGSLFLRMCRVVLRCAPLPVKRNVFVILTQKFSILPDGFNRGNHKLRAFAFQHDCLGF